MKEIHVNTPTASGKIYVGTDAVEGRLPLLTKDKSCFVVTDSNVYALYEDWFARYFANAEIFVLPAGEEHKTFQSLYAILEKMTVAGMKRTSRLFAVGGGVVGDIGGLAAALYMRGVSCVQIPTTLLAQVDSSVGGKTAVDLGGVKNVVGAFYQPCEVLVDPTFLRTLPLREIKCGVGEIVKYAALSEEIFHRLQALEDWENLESWKSLVIACIEHKAGVVERDEKESGERRSLNVGHTTGHAIELSGTLSHGEIVLWGMLFETKIAIRQGVCEREYGKELLRLVERALALPPQTSVDFSTLARQAEKARLDKKNTEDGKVQMAVAKAKGAWTMLSLPFDTYQAELLAVERI